MSAGSLTITSAEEAWQAWKAGMLGGQSSDDQLTIDCALLRNCLWALTEGRQPVHVLRVLNLAIEVSLERPGSSVAPELRRKCLREALDELMDASDAVCMPGGRWLPAPLREVSLGGGLFLIVGGLPTSLLPRSLACHLDHRGPLRLTRSGNVASALSLPQEHHEMWEGTPPSDLRAWANEAMAASLAPYDPADDEPGKFRLYAPAVARQGTPQGFRWVDLTGIQGGRYLAYRETPYGVRSYRVVELRGGKVTASGAPALGLGDIRRLLYGLDLLAGNPVETWASNEEGSIVLQLKSELPGAERRFLGALGELQPNLDAYYPRRWVIPVEDWSTMETRLKSLGIRILHAGK